MSGRVVSSREASEVLLALVADDELRGLDATTTECVLHASHSPLPWVMHAHYVIPLSWTRALAMAASRSVPLCATGHEALHSAIRSSIRGEEPYRQVDERVVPYLNEALGFWHAHAERLHALPGVNVAIEYSTEGDDEVRAPARLLGRFAERLRRGRG